MILETSFLVDLEREVNRGAPGPAQRFLDSQPDTRFAITWTIAGEFAAGMPNDARARWEAQVAMFDILPCTLEASWWYARTYRYLREQGMPIGANDLWIAAVALDHGRPVVTRNVREFRRVPGLEVVGY